MRLEERHILLVDDDINDLMLLQNLIENIDDEYEYTTYVARNAGEAVTAYAKNPIECAFIDFYMPQTNGINLIELLNKLPNHVSLHGSFPVIVVSGNNDESTRSSVEEADALAFVPKTNLTDANSVKSHIDKMLDVYQKEKEYIAY